MPTLRRPTAPRVVSVLFSAVVAVWFATTARGVETLESSGVAMIPEDAAFVSASLRIREQYDRIAKSNAWAAVKKLPFVSRALDSIEEQKIQPGSPLSILSTFMELPENEQALALLKEMVATDTFVYGEPSCTTFMELIKRVNQAQNAASLLQLASGEASVGGIEVDVLEGIDLKRDDGADIRRRPRVLPVRLQADTDDLSAESLSARLMVKTLAENVDLIVVPDLVWGFQIGKREVADFQLKRLEVLVKGIVQMNPALADSLERRKVAGGEMVTFTIKPDPNLLRSLPIGEDLGDAQDQLNKVFGRLEELRLVIGLGVIGDRVILSIGDSIEHLEKLARPGSGRKGLLSTKPLAPLVALKDKPITGVAYVSEALSKAVSPSAADIEQFIDLSDAIADLADLPDGAAEEARASLTKFAESYGRRLPIPGPWLSVSFLGEQGYEGYVWNWFRNLPFDGSKRLGILEHTGGAPLAVSAFRVKNDPGQFEDFVAWTDMAASFFRKYLVPKASPDVREKFEEIDEHLTPVARKLVGIVRTKILPALADGQLGFVIDGKSSTKRLHASLPSSGDTLPLIEPAIVLGVTDPKLLRDGMSDLFELADELVDAVREITPDGVPPEYRVPEPAKSKVEGGTIWSFAIKASGLDEKIQPAIAVGDDVAVLSLVPKQASRLLLETRLDTGSQLTKFEEPLAGAAALDFAGLVDLIQPWVVYAVRYGCVQQREGSVDSEAELGADDENDQAKEGIAHAKVIFEAIKSLRAAVSETSVQADGMVTHWRNVIRDLPAK